MQSLNQTFETSRGTIIIRESTPSDIAQFRELRLHALQDSPTAFSADYQTYLNHPMSFWEDRLKLNEHGTIFFAEHAEHLVGMMGIRIGQSVKTKHSADIWGVCVHRKWRGLHIAEALIDACVNWAKPRQVEMLKLGVTTTNTSAVRCYERCGFTTYGTDPRALFYEGIYYDEYLMSRTLDNS